MKKYCNNFCYWLITYLKKQILIKLLEKKKKGENNICSVYFSHTKQRMFFIQKLFCIVSEL